MADKPGTENRDPQLKVRPAKYTPPVKRIEALELQCARLKQQKRVAETFATKVQGDSERLTQQVTAMEQQLAAMTQRLAATEQRLADATRRASHFERMAEHRLAEVHHTKAQWDTSFQTRVELDVFRAVEATGDAQIFPYGLTPTLAAVQSKVGGAALQQRAARLADPDVHPLGLHPSVHEWVDFDASIGKLRAPGCGFFDGSDHEFCDV